MEVVGGASSVIAVCGLLVTCIRGLRRLYNTFKFAKTEVRLLMDEANICHFLFVTFNDITRPLESRVMKLAREKNLEKALQAQANLASEQIKRIMAKFRPLMNGISPSSFEQVFAKFRWHFTKHESQALMATFSTLKHSLNVLVGLLTLDDTLKRFSQESTASQDRDMLLGQIKIFKKMIRRQSKSLKELVKMMKNRSQNADESLWISNTESMVLIIEEIQKEPITEARAVISQERQDLPHGPNLTQRVHDPIRRQKSPPIGLGSTSSLPASRFASPIVLPASQEASYRAVESLSSARQTTRRSVTRDYRDGNRERYEVGSSSSSIRDDSQPHTLYVPMPPFEIADLHTRKTRKKSSGDTN